MFAWWRRPWRLVAGLGGHQRRLLLAWGAVPAVMNACFYEPIARLALGTVAAIEFLPVVGLAALGARSLRNAAALTLAVLGVYLLTDVRLAGSALGFAFAFANAGLFGAYVVLADRAAKRPALSGIDGLAAAIGAIVLGQAPTAAELAGLAAVVIGVALHRPAGAGAAAA